MTMKRQRDGNEGSECIDLANCLMLLPLPQESKRSSVHKSSSGPVEFECKTCNRKFSSFQALGGHRASHKRQKLDDEEDLKEQGKSLSLWNKPKMHECSICGLEFALGQALGGHMRKHRGEAVINKENVFSSSIEDIEDVIAKTPVLKRSTSTRIMCLDLDLNLTLAPPVPTPLF